MTATNSQTTKVAASGSNKPAPSPWRSGWWVVGVLLVVFGAFGLFSTPTEEQEELAARRQQIQNMSATERDRLERNYQRFQKLPSGEQEALLELSERVEADSSLKTTLTGYERWLDTLSPWERIELRNAKTVDEKLEVVQSINAVREREQEEYERQEQYYTELVKQNLPYNQSRKWEGTRLSDEELFEMLAVLNKDFGSQVKLSKNSLPGKAAYNLQLMAVALEHNLRTRTSEEVEKNPLPEETRQKMIATISHPDVKELYANLEPRDFVRHVAWKLQMAWWNEARHHYPKQSELDEIARTLGGRELVEFERRKEKEPRQAYFQLLLATRPATFKLDTKQLDTVLDELGIRQSSRRPPWGGGRFSTRGDYRRERDNDDDDRRGSRDRGNNSEDGRESSNEQENSPLPDETEPAEAEKP